MTPHASIRRAERAVEGLLVAVVLLLLFVGWTSYVGRRDLVDAQRVGCERGKLDRAANATAFRAQSDYLNLVLDAASVKADVKAAAATNQRAQDAAATDLESRTGDQLDCADAYPPAPLFPLP